MVKLWDLSSGEEFVSIKKHPRNAASVRLSPDGKMLASSGIGEVIFIWGIPSYKLLNELIGHKTVISALDFSNDGNFLASLGTETLKLWSIKNWELLHSIELKTERPLPMVISPDCKTIAVGSSYLVQLGDVKSRELKTKFDVKPKGVYTLSFSPDGKWLAMGATDKKIRI